MGAGARVRIRLQEDRKLGLIPFVVFATLGTTACCSMDALAELGAVCDRERVWLHVDGAYAGSLLLLPECRHIAWPGIEVCSDK